MTLKSYVSIAQIRDDGSIYYSRVSIDEVIKTYLNQPLLDNNISTNFNKISLNNPEYF